MIRTQLYSCGYDKRAVITDTETNIPVQTFEHAEKLTSICPHPDNAHEFLVGGEHTGIVCWDDRSAKVIRKYQTTFGEVQDLIFHPDNPRQFISSCTIAKRNATDKSIVVWDFPTVSTSLNT